MYVTYYLKLWTRMFILVVKYHWTIFNMDCSPPIGVYNYLILITLTMGSLHRLSNIYEKCFQIFIILEFDTFIHSIKLASNSSTVLTAYQLLDQLKIYLQSRKMDKQLEMSSFYLNFSRYEFYWDLSKIKFDMFYGFFL